MTIDELAQTLREPPNEHYAAVRWWLAEGLHTEDALRPKIDAAAPFGVGRVEFLAMEEDNVDDARRI
ncbi:hypothetical protein [Kocuria sp. U4B]